jgi:very-short-patch-repair endonuclease
VALRQLRALGLSDKNVHDRARAGHLHRRYRGVYAVGHRRLTRKGRWMAAVLACGPTAVLSHGPALVLWQLASHSAGPIDVTAVARGRTSPDGVRLHCVRALDPADRTTIDAIPVTTVARALLDYAETTSASNLRHALEAAERRELLDARQIADVLERSPGRRGSRPLRQAITQHTGEAPWTRSRLEREVLTLVRAAGLPEPHCNVMLHGELVDFYWPRYKLVLEADSWDFHRTRAQFEKDRRRDAILQVAGIRVLRVTQSRIEREPERVAAEIWALTRAAA